MRAVISILAALMTTLLAPTAWAQTTPTTFIFSTSSDDYTVSPTFSNVDSFAIRVEIESPLQVGVYNNPQIVSVDYEVTGDLEMGTPSGFPSFALEREITGEEFYAQGSSLSFEIAANAVLEDGVQAAELVGGGLVLLFNAREIDNGRFHPALLQLNADGTGSIRNSNNIVTLNPLNEVAQGAEYITELTYDTGNTTLMALPVVSPPPPDDPPSPLGSSGGAVNLWMTLMLGILAGLRRRRD